MIRDRLNRIHSLRKRVKARPTDEKLRTLQNAEDSLQSLMAQAKSDYEVSLIRNFKGNQKAVYQYIRRLSKSSSLPKVMYHNSTSATTDGEKAGLFNSYYPARACASKGLCDRSWCLYINCLQKKFRTFSYL